MCGGCVSRIDASGFRRSRLLRGRALRLAPRGFGNRQIAFTPCRRGVRASSRRPLPFLPETGRTSTRFVALSPPARSSRSPAHGRNPPTAPGLRLRGGCGAMLSSRAAPPSHPPRHASAGGVRAPSRSSRTVRSTAPRSAYIQSQDIHEITVRMKSSPPPARTNILFRVEFSPRLGDRVDAAVSRLHRKGQTRKG